MGFLKEKAKVLVTHQLQFLKPADEIILLNRGKIEARGSYKDLLKTGINFAKALHTDENATPKNEDKQNSGHPAQVVPEEFEWEDEPMIVKSYGRQYDSRREYVFHYNMYAIH